MADAAPHFSYSFCTVTVFRHLTLRLAAGALACPYLHIAHSLTLASKGRNASVTVGYNAWLADFYIFLFPGDLRFWFVSGHLISTIDPPAKTISCFPSSAIKH